VVTGQCLGLSVITWLYSWDTLRVHGTDTILYRRSHRKVYLTRAQTAKRFLEKRNWTLVKVQDRWMLQRMADF
jgi:hypothetical protein